MIEIDTIRWKNFLSYGNRFTEIDVSKITQVLIAGPNGHGKSTIMDALCFGLFGRPYRKIKLAKIVNSVNDKDCVVEVEFRVGKDSYKVVRGLKPSVFMIFENGKELDQSAKSRDFQKYLEESILHADQRTFTQIAFLGTSDSVPFMKLPAAIRRSVIEDVLSIRVFTAMHNTLNMRTRQLKDQVDNLNKDIDREKDKLSFLLKQVTPVSNEELIRKKEEELKKLIASIEKDEAELKEKQAQIGEQIKVPSVGKVPYYMSRLESNIKLLQNDLEFFGDNSTCPRCHQDIDETHKDQITSSIGEKIKAAIKGLEELEEKKREIEQKIEEAKKHNRKIQAREEDCALLKSSIYMGKGNINNLKEDIATLKKPVIAKDTKEIKKGIEQTIKELEDKLKDAMEQFDIHKKALVILKDDGVKTKVIEYYLPIFNSLIAKYLDAFDFNVQFTIDSEFNESIKSRFRDSFQYENFSDGERSRIDLALMFAFRELAVKRNTLSTNILILDEVDAAMDTDGASNLKGILYSEDFQNIKTITISHKDHLTSSFKDVLLVRREGNFSHID